MVAINIIYLVKSVAIVYVRLFYSYNIQGKLKVFPKV